jgi:hypothetical protein
MISGIARDAAEFLRSLDALAVLLKSSNEQAMQMAEKLVKIDVQQALQDSSVGTRIDASA